MKRFDSEPSEKIEVDFDLYIKRLEALCIHEIGHDVVRERAQHYQEAVWINAKTGHRLGLGLHCTDNKCVMYEVVDINAPPAEQGYMQLGEDKKYDAGLDEVIARLHDGGLCTRCKEAVRVDERYK